MAYIKCTVLIAVLCMPVFVFATELSQVALEDDNYLLLSVRLDNKSAGVTIDAYEQSEQVFVAVEPLLNGLKLRYQLREDQLTVWKGDDPSVFKLLTTHSETTSTDNSWGTDGYYQYVSQGIIETLFDVVVEVNKPKLTLTLNTNSYQFPITILAEQAELRTLNQAYSYSYHRKDDGRLNIPITIPDQYKLVTLPHGDVSSTMDLSNDVERIRTRVQLVSDLLYHSARINLSNEFGEDISGGLSFSRFKSTPDDRILGAFDQYRFGDISSSLGAGIISGSSGVGMVFERMPEGYRRSNSKIDIEQDATPGWDAELFLNGRFIAAATVPETGLLVFEDVDIYYGANEFLIKVYGPYAEVDTYQKSYPLIANPLAEGGMAYNIHALDNSRSLFNNNNDEDGLSINSIGGSFDYGINDTWQIGATFQNRSDFGENQQFMSLHNYVNLPGFLLENQFAFNADIDFAQQTSLSGNLWGGASFQIKYDSNHNLDAPTDRTLIASDFQRLTASYFDYIGNLPLTLRMSYADVQGNRVYTVTNNIFYNFKRLRFSHDITYSKLEQTINGGKITSDSIAGNVGVSGMAFRDFRLSAQILYNPDAPDVILDSSFLRAQYRWQGPFDYQHYFNFNYRPITKQDNDWQFTHSLAYETSDYRLSFNSAYDAQDKWSIGLNVNFFLGYDYHNNRALTSSTISSGTAMLNIHSYLDRQLNGVPDVLDYDLEGVEFNGRPEWEGLTSGEEGKIILPGVPTNSLVRVGAKWKHGSKTINNDYVVYTHPGASIDVNMPFYLNTELAGFTFRLAENGEVPVSDLVVELLDKDGDILESVTTDSDGYFEFTNIQPSSYTVAIKAKDLNDKGLTGEFRGYKLTTPSVGGFIELPVLILRQLKSDEDGDLEAISEMIINEDDVELLIWDDKEEVRQNYFTLPTKEKITAPHTPPESDQQSPLAIKEPMPIMEHSIVTDEVLPLVEPVNRVVTANSYTIQLGAFVGLDTAKSVANEFEYQVPIDTTIFKTQNDKWQTIYKVYLGDFVNRSEAVAYANRYRLEESEYIIVAMQGEALAKKSTMENLVEGVKMKRKELNEEALTDNGHEAKSWVVQFYASRSKIASEEAARFEAIGDVFMAKKIVQSTGDVWYCLISNGFETKAQAQAVQKRAEVGGWVNDSKLYSEVVKLK